MIQSQVVQPDLAGFAAGSVDLSTSWRDDGLGRNQAAYAPTVAPAYAYLPGVSPYRAPDPTGRQTNASYDGLGRPTIITGTTGFTTTSSDGWTTTVVDGNGHQQQSEQDAYGRLLRVTEYTGQTATNPGNLPVSATTRYANDVGGRLTRITDTLGHTTAITSDAIGRKTALTDPDTGTWTYSYDNASNLRTQTDARGTTVTFSYDALNRLTAKSSPRVWGPVTAGGVVSLTDLEELRTAVDYDRLRAGVVPAAYPWTDRPLSTATPVKAVHFNELKTAMEPLTGLKSFTRGSLSSGRTIAAQDLADLRSWLDAWEAANPTTAAKAAYTYDEGVTGRGRRTGMRDESGQTTYGYDVRGQVTSVTRTITDPRNNASATFYSLSFGYDHAGSRTSVTYPTGETVNTTMDAQGLPNGVTGSLAGSPTTYLSGLTYNRLGLPVQLSYDSGVNTTFAYYGLEATDTSPSSFGRLWQIRTFSGGSEYGRLEYGYDRGGNVTLLADWGASGFGSNAKRGHEVFTYDERDRLGSAGSQPSWPSSNDYSATYSYNEIGNLTRKHEWGPGAYSEDTTLAYNNAAHVHAPSSVTTSGTPDTYGYDANGNLLSRPGQTFQYDAENRLVRRFGHRAERTCCG